MGSVDVLLEELGGPFSLTFSTVFMFLILFLTVSSSGNYIKITEF